MPRAVDLHNRFNTHKPLADFTPRRSIFIVARVSSFAHAIEFGDLVLAYSLELGSLYGGKLLELIVDRPPPAARSL
jgi:hypothetical protein